MIKRILSALLCATVIFTLSMPVFADENYDYDYDTEYADLLEEGLTDEDEDTNVATTGDESEVFPAQRLQPRLVDEADVLLDEDENVLTQKLNEISNRQKFDVTVVIISSLDGSTSVDDTANNYFVSYGYGMGDNKDGALLLLVINTHDWCITTHGYGRTVITNAGSEKMSEMFIPFLQDKEYDKAIEKYADLCDEYITQANTGEPYDVGNLPSGDFPFWKKLGIALIAGFLLAFIVVTIMKSKLTTVKAQDSAADYTKEGSMVINESRDMFLYSHVSKTEKPKDSGGSSVSHKSSGSFSSHSGKW